MLGLKSNHVSKRGPWDLCNNIVELVASVGENGPLLCMWENVIGHVTLVAIDGTIILVPYLLT